MAVKWRNEGWSRPLLPDHAELAASEQAQLEAARARRGWRPIRRALTSQFDKGTHRRRTTTKQCPPLIASADFFVPSRNVSDEGQQQQAYIFAIPTVAKMEEDECRSLERSTERSTVTPARPGHHQPGPREAERALVRVREAERVLARAKARLPVKAREVKRAQAKAEALAKAHELVLSRMAQMAMPQRRSIADLILSPRNASAEWRQQTHLFDMERALAKTHYHRRHTLTLSSAATLRHSGRWSVPGLSRPMVRWRSRTWLNLKFKPRGRGVPRAPSMARATP